MVAFELRLMIFLVLWRKLQRDILIRKKCIFPVISVDEKYEFINCYVQSEVLYIMNIGNKLKRLNNKTL